MNGYDSTSQVFTKQVVDNTTNTTREVIFVIKCPYCGITLNKRPHSASRYGCPNCGYKINISSG